MQGRPAAILPCWRYAAFLWLCCSRSAQVHMSPQHPSSYITTHEVVKFSRDIGFAVNVLSIMPLTTRISLDAQRTIEGAFNDLKDAISTTDFAQLKDTTLDDVQQSMHKIEEYLSARGWVRNLRRLLPLITGLGHYSKTIEVLCNGTPFLPWIWAPIKLILKVLLSLFFFFFGCF